jgi:phenylpyruvate tautomerase PptA (4-oxalocrotonate tautomerase family)
MPMIDVYATAGTFADPHQLATDLAAAVMTIEQVPDIPMFRQNTAAFLHDLPAANLSNVDGDTNYVRIQVLTNAGALDRAKQLAVVEQLTRIAADAAGDPTLASRTWVLLTEAPDGGWGLDGHANTNEELVAAARAQIANLQAGQPSAESDPRARGNSEGPIARLPAPGLSTASDDQGHPASAGNHPVFHPGTGAARRAAPRLIS